MTSLEFCHELDYSKVNFVERKVRITHPKTIIYGAPKVGKSFLVYDFLNKFESKEYIYINLNDLRIKKEDFLNDLEKYIFKNKIKVLVLENFQFDFKIPYCDNVIITTNKKTEIKGFKTIFLGALDFEEYLLHDKKNQNLTNNFNFFLKYGNLPSSLETNEHKVFLNLQEILKNISEDKTSLEILKVLLLNIDEKKSLYQLYQALKKEIKISKDKFYLKCNEYEEKNIIYFIEKYNQEKAVKKIYSYNWSFLNAVSYQKKFKNELTNMIFCELLKTKENIYYLDNVDFYIPSNNMAIVSIPFFNSKLMQNQLKRIIKIIKENKITLLNIITISNNEHFFIESIEIDILPFYEWALS